MKTYNDFITEEKKEKYEYGCAMIYFDSPLTKKLQEEIDENDLYTEEGDRSFGFEKEPHVTLLYGLHDDVDENDVMRICADEIPPLVLANASAFENEKFDVLKFDVDSEKLHEINAKLCELPHTTDFPDYHPHSTIAYLKPGTAKKYIETMKEQRSEVKPSQIVYSKADGTKIKKDL
jgi:2'-5' RNA ligase